MPKQISGAELEAIIDVVAGLPDGGSVDAVRGALVLGIARRTLQRRLSALVSEGRLVRTGRGPGSRYLLPDGQAAPPGQYADAGEPPSAGYYIPLSSDGASISRAVHAPIHVYCQAYERSSARYSVIRQSLGESDPFRLRHRSLIAETIRSVVAGGMARTTAGVHIQRRATEALPAEDRSRFIELVETDVMNLHEGNLARVRLSPAEYSAWKAGWR